MAATEVPWIEHAMTVALAFASNCIGDTFLGEFPDGKSAIQWTQGPSTVTLHVADSDSHPLPLAARVKLANQRFVGPTRTRTGRWSIELPWAPNGDNFSDNAAIIARTTRRVLGIARPEGLTYRGFNIGRPNWPISLPIGNEDAATAATIGYTREQTWEHHRALGHRVIAQEFPEADVLTVAALPPNRLPGRPSREDPGEYFMDRILVISAPEPAVVIASHLSSNGLRGFRHLTPLPVDGEWAWAIQGTEAYYRHLLATTPALSLLTRRQRDRVTALLNAGRLQVYDLDIYPGPERPPLRRIPMDRDRLGALTLPPDNT